MVSEGDQIEYEATDGLTYEFTVEEVDDHNRKIRFQNGSEFDKDALGSDRFTVQ